MTYTFNYTGRYLLDRELISIEVAERDDEIVVKGSVDLTGATYPGAEVRLEAYRRGDRHSFRCGTATGQVSLDQTFPRFASPDAILYEVKVVAVPGSRDAGKILAIRKRIRPDGGAEGLLPFVSVDLGQELWRFYAEDSEGELPEVQINSKVPDIRALAKDPRFVAIAMPGIARNLALWLKRQLDDEVSGDHVEQIAAFFEMLGVAPTGSDDDWIEPAVEAFCSRHGFVDKWLAMGED